jgi:hypothetical protein
MHRTHSTAYAYTAEIDRWHEQQTTASAPAEPADHCVRIPELVGRATELSRLDDQMRRALRWIRARYGDPPGVEMIKNSLMFQHAGGIRHWIPLMNGWLVESLIRSAEFKAALAAIDDGLNMVRQTDVRTYEAELYGLRSDALKGLADTEPCDEQSTTLVECGQMLSQSLAIARTQSAKMLELRAALRRVRLVAERSREAEAYDELSRVYGAIEGGANAPDVIEAAETLRRR